MTENTKKTAYVLACVLCRSERETPCLGRVLRQPQETCAICKRTFPGEEMEFAYPERVNPHGLCMGTIPDDPSWKPEGYGFNDNHPECGPDEIWIGNWYPEREHLYLPSGGVDTNPRPAGRMGDRAYDIYGKRLPGAYPFFRKKIKDK